MAIPKGLKKMPYNVNMIAVQLSMRPTLVHEWIEEYNRFTGMFYHSMRHSASPEAKIKVRRDAEKWYASWTKDRPSWAEVYKCLLDQAREVEQKGFGGSV